MRLYSWESGERIDADFFVRRLDSALDLRRDLGLLDPEGACRLVFSEGDGVSGLVVDRYRDLLSVQLTSRWRWRCAETSCWTCSRSE